LKSRSGRPHAPKSKLSLVFLILSAAGIGDAIYTAYEYATHNFPGCSVLPQIFSCQTVSSSGHTSILGIPFYVLGLVWFPLLFVAGLASTNVSRTEIQAPEILLLILIVGDVFTVYLWYLEIFVIGAYCPFCISLYAINYVLTGIAAKALFF
jgi:uncharacterized membrane protein